MKTSKLWDSLAKDKFAKIDAPFLSNFREPGNANNRLAAWDPFDKSMRYFKFLFFHQIQTKDNLFFSNYAKIGDTSLGNPVTLDAPSGQAINLDHFFSIEEYTFLKGNMNLEKIAHVVEIGAGFGRTAQALIKLAGNIKKYTIIDIPQVLSLSRSYLAQVLNREEFAKLGFVNALSLPRDRLCFDPVDLVINIDSFQEMPKETIGYYFERIINDAHFFYSKNAVGKYRPESVGLYDVNEKQLLDVFSLGLSTDVIDIFSERELEKARQKHVEQYRPKQFGIIAQEPLGIFPYYQNVLYGRGGDQ
jgi:putative sugar O-methyltransferase